MLPLPESRWHLNIIFLLFQLHDTCTSRYRDSDIILWHCQQQPEVCDNSPKPPFMRCVYFYFNWDHNISSAYLPVFTWYFSVVAQSCTSCCSGSADSGTSRSSRRFISSGWWNSRTFSLRSLVALTKSSSTSTTCCRNSRVSGPAATLCGKMSKRTEEKYSYLYLDREYKKKTLRVDSCQKIIQKYYDMFFVSCGLIGYNSVGRTVFVESFNTYSPRRFRGDDAIKLDGQFQSEKDCDPQHYTTTL